MSSTGNNTNAMHETNVLILHFNHFRGQLMTLVPCIYGLHSTRILGSTRALPKRRMTP